MIFINECYKVEEIPKEYINGFIKLLYPIAPHICEEMSSRLFGTETLTYEKWPEYDEEKTLENEIEIGVQVNGKLRASIKINKDEEQEIVKEKALNEENVIKNIEGKEIVKVIVVPNRIVNIVVK